MDLLRTLSGRFRRTASKLSILLLVVALGLVPLAVKAQTAAPLADLGATTPTPSPQDISQLSIAGETNMPDQLNYYTDNQTDQHAGEPGQTFTTASNPAGYILNSLAVQTGGGSSSGLDVPKGYLLHIYSVAGGAATPIAAYSAGNFSYTDGDWLQWTGLSVALAANSTYAFSFGEAVSGDGWDAMANAGGNPYSGGQIGLFPPAGGAITFGSGNFDAAFDVGLLAGSAVGPAAITNLPASNITSAQATLNGQVLSTGGQTPSITMYYGASDGGTNPAGWANSVSLGQQSGTYSAAISALAPNTAYYFTASAANIGGVSWATPSGTFTTASGPPLVSVLTYHNDNTRQGANTNEAILTPGNVNSSSFGRLFNYPVDGYVFAQPLIMTNVSIPGKGIHNVVYVCTEHDSVYAFDADSNTGATGGLLWQTSLGVSAVTPNNDFGGRYGAYHDVTPEMGITDTPVIDPVSGTLYVDAFTHEGTGIYFHRIHALNITTGAERPSSPVVVAASISGVGVGSSGGVLAFNPEQSLNRCAMTLASGRLYATYTGYADTDPYHGWILAYNPTNLQQLTNYIFNTSPNSTIAVWGANAGECGIWMGGNGPCVDTNNNLFFETGNGPFNADTNVNFNSQTTRTEYGDSFVKLSTTNSFAVADYFTPGNQASLAGSDSDLGAGGPMLLPDSLGAGTNRHLIVGCGKEGTIYLLNRDGMGHYGEGPTVQTLGNAVGGTWSSPAYFNNLIYYLGNGDVLKAFSIANAQISAAPVSRSATSYGFPGATPSVSANGASNGIVWAIQADGSGSGGAAILHAYNATNVAQELYNSSQNFARDNPGGAVKMVVPTIANGKVYVGSQYVLSVFGNASFLANPTISPNGGVFTNSVTVTLTDATPGTTIYYTLDGTTPTTNSLLYTNSFALTNNTAVNVMAVKAGAANSGVSSAAFVNSSTIGTGVGLTGSYYSNHTSTNPFTGSPTLVRVDPTVNFNWGAGSPDPSISVDQFTVRWTGSVQPQFNETYTFYATADDGVRVYINGQLLINGWVDQAATTYQAAIALKAQQHYTIAMEYYEDGGNASAQLAWSSPSTPQAVIPQLQLYTFTNPPPGVVLVGPANNASYTAPASVTLNATAAAQYNSINNVAFYAGATLLGAVTNSPYILTKTGLAEGSYALTAVVTDGSGLISTSAPVNITVTAATGQPYGLAARAATPAFFNMPAGISGTLPGLLSQTGVFSDTPSMTPTGGLIPYSPNVPLWSDGAVKTRWMSVPYSGGLETSDQQIGFATNGEWTFPTGTIFIKHFALVVDETNPNVPPRRLETRLLVRDPFGAVYGVTYKWRPDNSDAELLTGSLNEDILITNASGVRTQTWYYPSPSDCLACHTPAANYVLGVKTRQLNGNFTYPSSGVTDNQLRTLNRLGLLNPAFNESAISNYTKLLALTNQSASAEDRSRSYIDANCAQCHRPGGPGPTFDARFDTPLVNQNIINGLVLGNLGYDNARVVAPDDIWRSMLYQRANSVNPLIKMPPLARNLVDTNAMAVIAAWINGLPGAPALAPPSLNPAGGTFNGLVSISVTPPDTNAAVYYTLDGSLPTTNSFLYSGPFVLTNTATVNANAFEVNFNNSVATNNTFVILPALYFSAPSAFSNGVFQVQLSGAINQNYILQASTDLVQWIPIATNTPSASPFYLTDPDASNFPSRFYRAIKP